MRKPRKRKGITKPAKKATKLGKKRKK